MQSLKVRVWLLRAAYNRRRGRPYCDDCGRHLPDVLVERCRCGQTLAARLYDTDRVDEVLSRRSLEEIADAWTGFSARWKEPSQFPRDDPGAWAGSLWLNKTFLADEQRVRAGLRLLVERAPNDDVLNHIGAGPLEDFMTNDDFATNEDRLQWIEVEAARSPKFRAAVANVYARPSLTQEQNARLQRAADAN